MARFSSVRTMVTLLNVAMSLAASVPAAHAQPVQVRFVTYNVDFNNTAAEVDEDIQALKPEADIMMFQEAKNVSIADSFGSSFNVYHVVDQGDAKAGSALAIRKSIAPDLLASGLRFGVDSNGEDMLDRYIAWADIRLSNDLVIRIMSLHMPPQRFEYLQPIMADSLVTFVGQSPYPVIVGADWNYTVNNDTYAIQDQTGLSPKGVGIDGFHYSPQTFEFQSISALTALGTNSGHDPVRMIANVDTPTIYIVDNAYASSTVPAEWSTGTSATDKFGMDYRFKNQGTGSYVSFVPRLIRAGNYNVQEWHSQGTNRTQGAPHLVNFDGSSDLVLKNQETNGGGWRLVGNFNFTTGTAGNVRITDSISELAPKVVIADAIRFVYQGPAVTPPVPGGLSATTAGTSSIALSWQNTLNETGYIVARSVVSGGPYTNIATLPANTTSYSSTGLTPGTRYYYVVRATNGAGASSNSTESTAMTNSVSAVPDWQLY